MDSRRCGVGTRGGCAGRAESGLRGCRCRRCLRRSGDRIDRVLRAVVAMVAVAATGTVGGGGCSFATMHSPHGSPPECSESVAAPVVDIAVAIASPFILYAV